MTGQQVAKQLAQRPTSAAQSVVAQTETVVEVQNIIDQALTATFESYVLPIITSTPPIVGASPTVSTPPIVGASPTVSTPIPSPTNTLMASNAILLLDKNYLCKEGPGLEFSNVVTMIKGLKLPIFGRSEKDKWCFVQVQFGNFENRYCWINGGIVEGNFTSIAIIKQ